VGRGPGGWQGWSSEEAAGDALKSEKNFNRVPHDH